MVWRFNRRNVAEVSKRNSLRDDADEWEECG